MSLFITFEGPDGAGKTTQVALLAAYLTDQGHNVIQTREPGGTAIGDQIRQVLHDVDNAQMTSEAEILLYSASRAQLVGQLIKPHLAAKATVLCDRYADSTYAYQGYGRGLDLVTLTQITHFATQGLKPDLTFFLDLPVEVGLARKQVANQIGAGEWNRMDQLALEFHQRVRQGFLALAQADPKRWRIIDANQPVEVVQQIIRASIQLSQS